MEVQEVPVGNLQPWSGNPRINDHAVDAVARSIEEFGFNVPVLCNAKYRIIAGHTRWKAAMKLGRETLPVIVLNLSESQRRAFAVADNKTAEIASWDYPALGNVLRDLQMEEFDLPSLGFDGSQLEAILEPTQEIDWSDFEDNSFLNHDDAYVRLLVKVASADKESIRAALKEKAIEWQLSDRDQGVAAGRVISRLLENARG